jgi:dTDP-4-amino-4,6-dideoxygalactose transaminase
MDWKVPYVNYPLQYSLIKDELDEAYHRVMQQGDLIFRKDLIDFESNIAKRVNQKHGISMDSCTNAMFLSLYALGIGKGDEVITVDHTYIATIDVIVRCGAKPILIDVRDDFNMNPELIESVITKKTKAIMPVHLNGRSCDMDAIKTIADKYGLFIIEDVAQSLGAYYKGKPVGSYGVSSCYSLYPAKILGSYGDGGIACVNDDDLAMKLYLLRDHGERPSYLKTDYEKKMKDNIIEMYGFNTLLDNIQCAWLNVKLKYFDSWLERRREIARMYNDGMDGCSGIKLPLSPSDGDYYDVYQNYVIRSDRRDKLLACLTENGIETLVKWRTPNYKQKALKNLHKFKLPKTDEISREVISLPMYPELTNEQVEYTCDVINKFYKEVM